MRFRKYFFETVTSTQILAREHCATNQAQSGDVFFALEQTQGYGRRGRAWISPPGNLSITLIESLREVKDLSWLGFAMGLGLFDAINPFLKEGMVLQVKWPNDLLLNGMKLSGLLLEVVDDKILIGVGLNVLHAPETDQTVTSLRPFVQDSIKAEELVDPILSSYDAWYQVGLRQGFAGMRQSWLDKAAFKGQEITARLANGIVLKGIFHDLDPHGALVLQTEEGGKMITAADIYLTGTI